MIDRDAAVLVVLDFQDKLLEKIPSRDGIVGNALKLLEVCVALDAPVVWTEQYPKGLGRTTQAIADRIGALLPDAVPIEKLSFGCFGSPGFVEAVEATGRSQVVIAGIETHVCVLQTALAGLEAGYEMYVVRDAVGSRKAPDFEAGLDRMRSAGVHVATSEMVVFELLREAGTPEFKLILPLLK